MSDDESEIGEAVSKELMGEAVSRKALLEAFTLFDKDGDGVLNRDELRRALGPGLSTQDLDVIINDFDANGDGVLQYDEMVEAWTAMGLRIPRPMSSMSVEERADSIFSALDADSNGTISVKELEGYLLARDAWLTSEGVTDIMLALDTNQDGVVTREELVDGLKNQSSGPPPLDRMMATRPPPSGNAVFDELVRPGGPIAIPNAEERAITLGQLKRTFEHASHRCHSEGWLGKRPTASDEWKYEHLTPGTISLYDMCSHVILPATHDRYIDGTTKPSYVELMADGSQPPDYFVSHFWGEPVADFIACIAQHTRDRMYGGGYAGQYQAGAIPGVDGDAAAFWVCAYANRQWHLSDDVTEDPAQTSFHKAISISKGTIALIDRDGKYFSRIWCCYEIFQSLRGDAASDAAARHGGRYTFDVYTSHQSGAAVGITDGIANWDRSQGQKLVLEGDDVNKDSEAPINKNLREKVFPSLLLMSGMTTRVEKGDASVSADKKHILNAIANSDDLNAPYATTHVSYDLTNATVRGYVAVGALKRAMETGGELLDTTFDALSKAEGLRALEIWLGDLDGETTPEMMSRFTNSLPVCLERLQIKNDHDIHRFDRLAELVHLEHLHLRMIWNLEKLPELSKLMNLKVLKLNANSKLKVLPDLSACTQLVELDLREQSFRDFPGLSSLVNLETLYLDEGLADANKPDTSMLRKLVNTDGGDLAYESE